VLAAHMFILAPSYSADKRIGAIKVWQKSKLRSSLPYKMGWDLELHGKLTKA